MPTQPVQTQKWLAPLSYRMGMLEAFRHDPEP